MILPTLYWTIGGDLYIGDKNDEDAPLCKVTFHNKWAKRTRQERIDVIAALADALDIGAKP